MGWAFGASSSRRIAAELVWSAGSSEIALREVGGGILIWGTAQKIEALAGANLLVFLQDGWRFEAEGPDAKIAFSQLPGPRPTSWLEKLEQASIPRLALFTVASIAGLFATWRWGLDILVAIAVTMTPPAILTGLDKSQMVMLDKLATDESGLSVEEKAKVTAIFDKLVAVAPVPKSGAYTLIFRDMGDDVGPNAFALPGGTMVVTDAIVRAFPDPNILAGVLGHEIGHVTQLHGLRQMYRSLTSYVLLIVIVGDSGSIVEELLLNGNAILSLQYSRNAEAESDRLGVALANKAGYDGAELATFFEALAEDEDDSAVGSNWLSTHPSSQTRVEDIRRMAAQ